MLSARDEQLLGMIARADGQAEIYRWGDARDLKDLERRAPDLVILDDPDRAVRDPRDRLPFMVATITRAGREAVEAARARGVGL